MAAGDERPELAFASAADLERWLDEHHAAHDGMWLKIAKKGTGVATVTIAEAIDAGLCFGWIDGQTRRFDEVYYGVRFTPRRPRSVWSKRNVQNVERLTAEGRMRPAGLEQVERAKADGRWGAAYDGAATATVPEDLQAILDAEPAVAATFAGLSAASRYAILYRLQTAVRPETRARRLERLVADLREGRAPHA
jgi:uncharacterized protein YdeI (YjbR/CyaY-like superfamily)